MYAYAQTQRAIETKFFTAIVNEPVSASLQADHSQRLTNGKPQ
jgi:hypothetical protein